MKFVTKVIFLKFITPVSLDSLEENLISSFTLWGALISAGFKLGVGDNLLEASLKGELLLSSAFPVVEYEGKEIFFVPKPLSWNLINLPKHDTGDEVSYKIMKSFKKRGLIPAAWLREIREQRDLYGRLLDDKGLLKKYNVHKEEIPKVSLDRATSSPNLYFWTIAFTGSNTLFYFLVKGIEDLWEQGLLPALRLLSEEGLGGKRSWGLGRFEFEERELPEELMDIQDGDTYLALSKFIPSDRRSLKLWNTFLLPSTYSLVHSKGISVLRPKILCYTEGSLLKEVDNGVILNLKSLYERTGAYYPKNAPEVFLFLRPYLLKFKDIS